MEAAGVHFDLSTDTSNALDKLQRNRYDVIISDMGRGLDRHAGFTLLDKIRKLGIQTPFIIYAGSSVPEIKAEAARKGVFATTNNPQEVFQLVINAIRSVQ